ncbi:hypothetical protein Moror_2225 [Moniliophthora roreri MCA 2997]|uniref:Uncharacterized protein n=2 Tax=Moniliophthora roreri TaxID=221103 RepID=V2W6A6_MONRO|nr:hypothetical protein Moror_2225 [Moniliophthora roreri MCA 2997]KAI3619322.1 hypothetical protein WG66_012978 [Moniliophthora roreri]
MAPLSTVSLPPSTVLPNTSFASNPSNATLRSALNSDYSFLPIPLLITLFVITILYHLLLRVFDWRFPVQSVDALQEITKRIEQLIRENSSVRKNLLKDYKEEFKGRLRILDARLVALKNREEPARFNVFAWTIFRWRVVQEADGCWLGLRELQTEVEAKLGSARTSFQHRDCNVCYCEEAQ